MPQIPEGETVYVQGSAEKPYELKNVGGVLSCSCPAWRNQGGGIDRRTCKHLKAYVGEAEEMARIGQAIAANPDAPAGRTAAKATPVSSGGRGMKKETAPPVLLAHRWENDVDLTGWWMSEKLDGVRAYWDGTSFLSRLGNAFQAPDWFIEGLPDHPLDGELWVGRKMFQETMSIVRRFDKSDDWKRVKYVLFDAPAHGGPFEKRLEFLRKNFAEGTLDHCHAIKQEQVRDMKHLKDELARVEALGGEGLMVRQPGSQYVAARSSTLLKIKSFFDAEAKVVGHVAGAGKHKGRLGALDVVLPDGTRFSVGTGFSDAERNSPPEIGAIVTFRYQELSKDGVPRFPSYVCVREDFEWPGDSSGKKSAKPEPVRKAINPVNPQGNAPVVKKTTASKPVPAPAPKAAAGDARRFELVDGSSSKFWEIRVEQKSTTVRFGRIGSDGQTKTKTFPSAAAAQAEAGALIAEKTGKGYVEKGGAPAPSVPAEPRKTEAVSEELSAMVRTFQSPKSKERVEIEVHGARWSLRRGGGEGWAAGGSEEDEYDSPDVARAAAELKIAELVKQGFIETTKGSGGWAAAKPRPSRAMAGEPPPAPAGRKISGVQDSAKKSAKGEGTMAKRHFEFKEGSSNKFWEIELEGESLTTWWGRIGTAGQNKTKDFGDEDKAKKEYDKLVASKLKEGYVEGGASGDEDEDEEEAPAPKKVAKKVAAKPAADEDEDEDEEETRVSAATADGGGNGKRHFEFKEGSSNKFWEIALAGSALTTWWGRIGTAGQNKTKDFGDAAKAKHEYDKLVASKLKEGYQEG